LTNVPPGSLRSSTSAPPAEAVRRVEVRVVEIDVGAGRTADHERGLE